MGCGQLKFQLLLEQFGQFLFHINTTEFDKCFRSVYAYVSDLLKDQLVLLYYLYKIHWTLITFEAAPVCHLVGENIPTLLTI